MMLLGEGLRIIGPGMAALQAPVIAVFLTALQQTMLWRRSPDEVFNRIEARFPAMVSYLKAVAQALGLESPPPPSPPPNGP
jgi:hypothetical protein